MPPALSSEDGNRLVSEMCSLEYWTVVKVQKLIIPSDTALNVSVNIFLPTL
jgi:hypothetical protein